jgi:hypothetical protein
MACDTTNCVCNGVNISYLRGKVYDSQPDIDGFVYRIALCDALPISSVRCGASIWIAILHNYLFRVMHRAKSEGGTTLPAHAVIVLDVADAHFLSTRVRNTFSDKIQGERSRQKLHRNWFGWALCYDL